MMTITPAAPALPQLPQNPQPGQLVELHGAAYRVREMSGFAFVVLSTARELVQTIFIPDECETPREAFAEGDQIEVVAEVRPEPRSKSGYDLILKRVTRLGGPAGEPPVVINKKELGLPLDTNLQYRSLSLRNDRERAIFRIQAALAKGMADFLEDDGFTAIRTPKLVSAGAEGGSNIFALDYFGRKAYLAQSPQLYKQAMVGVFERVYEMAPVFRAEHHDTSRHLNEYTSVDFEMGFIRSFHDIMAMETAMLRAALDYVRATCAQELAQWKAKVPEIAEIPALKFREAKELLRDKLGREVTDWHDFEPAEEVALCDYIRKQTGSEFVFVTHYPSAKRPFYAMDDTEDPGYTLSFDLLFRGLEVTTGGQRIHDYDAQVAKMQERGMHVEEFESYLLIHKSGMPPHGGLGLGLERLTTRLLGLDNVRQACLYPRDINRLEP